MNRNADDFDRELDQALDRIRRDELPEATRQAISERVWARVGSAIADAAPDESEPHRIRDCSDFQALIPAYLRGGLNEAKSLLLSDHVTSCVPCRKTLIQARDARRRARAATAGATEPGWAARWSWRLAAAAVIVVALVGLSVKTDLFTVRTGGVIFIEAIDGDVFQITGDGPVPLQVGDSLSFEDGRLIRTGRDSGAIFRTSDDSVVEVSERAELSVQDRRKLWNVRNPDSVIELNRGSVIVEASEQGSGHLYVDTPDAMISVTGTVFAVNRGIKGSRVSVLEGEVAVNHSGGTHVLHPGEQATTQPGLGQVPVEDEIAWSRQLDKHLALLREFAELGREIDRAVVPPNLRYGTALLDRVPDDTFVYVAIPNLSSTISQAYDLMRDKISGNGLLNQWWEESIVTSGADAQIELAMEKIRSYGPQIGEEIVVTVGGIDRAHGDPSVLILAELVEPEAFLQMVRTDLTGLRLLVGDGSIPDVAIVDDTRAMATGSDLYLWVRDGLLAVTSDTQSLQRFADAVEHGGASPFYGSSFHTSLAQRYHDGVQWVIGVDMERLELGQDSGPARQLEALGILDMQHLIGEHEEDGVHAQTRAELTFDQPRRGIAAWLAEPAPMGAMDYVSRNAYFAAGFVMKEPVQVVDEMIDFLGSEDTGFAAGLEEFEREAAIDIRNDIAAAIGGEFAFALESPVLPTPSWKLIVEVYDPVALQNTLEWAVERVNVALAEQFDSAKGLTLEQSDRGRLTYYELRSLDTGISAYYTFVDGYMIASASRALIERSLQFRNSGLSLASSAAFTSLLPVDAEPNFSAVVYQDWGPILGPLTGGLTKAGRAMGPEGQKLFDSLGSLSGPNLTLAYGEESRITLINTTEGGLLGRGLTSILSLDSLLSVRQLVDRAVQEQASDPSDGAPQGVGRADRERG
ncbi:MAG TPA: FecR domain-containing protein [Candidatus Polarisedimenticolaceae bacterium]|nr:FecR domain-containing protein [Candidatus Polarisedimenticolaceae bacterium]